MAGSEIFLNKGKCYRDGMILRICARKRRSVSVVKKMISLWQKRICECQFVFELLEIYICLEMRTGVTTRRYSYSDASIEAGKPVPSITYLQIFMFKELHVCGIGHWPLKKAEKPHWFYFSS